MKAVAYIIMLVFILSAARANPQCLKIGARDVGTPLSSSGNAALDQLVSFHAAALARMLQVRPEFYFTDAEEVNAVAHTGMAGSDGTIYFFRGMIDDCAGADELRLISVLAHEFGHIWTAKNGWRMMFTGVQEELFCDFVAGMYISQYLILGAGRPNGQSDLNGRFARLRPLLDTQGRFGDYYFDSPEHHGTPSERNAAMFAGFKAPMILSSRGFNGPGPHFFNGKYYSSQQLGLIFGADEVVTKGRY